MRAILVLLMIVGLAWADTYDDGMDAANRGDWQTAVRHFAQAIGENPNNAKAHHNRGYSYAELGDYSKAIDDLTQAIRLDPNDAWAYGLRGYLYGALGDRKKATEDARKACDLGKCNLIGVYK